MQNFETYITQFYDAKVVLVHQQYDLIIGYYYLVFTIGCR